jgi:hypothetical protein
VTSPAPAACLHERGEVEGSGRGIDFSGLVRVQYSVPVRTLSLRNDFEGKSYAK